MKSSNRVFFAALALLFVLTGAAFLFILKNAKDNEMSGPGRVAILDTGINLEGVFRSARVRVSVERDWDGAGTHAATWVLRECGSCEVLGFQVSTQEEAGRITLGTLTDKIDEAIHSRADVILISSRSLESTWNADEFKAFNHAIGRAYSQGMIIIVGAGNKPRDLDKSWVGALSPKVLVVGALVSWTSANEAMGFGRCLDWVVAQMGIPEREQGTSAAAAWVAGIAGDWKAENPNGHTEDFRSYLAHEYLIPHQKLPEGLKRAPLEKIGHGVLDLSTRGSK